MTEGTRYRAVLLVLFNALILALASPVYMPQFLPGGTGRNIRHLPCVSRRSGETGVCMFAFTCAKANGTHLGTCIDRFYFGSCCKIDREPEIFHHDNTIDDGEVKPYPTSHGSIESNNIPEYSPEPTPTPTPRPSTFTSKAPVRVTEATLKITETTLTSTEKPVKVAEHQPLGTTRAPVSKPVKIAGGSTEKYTRRPVPDSTTESVGLSTFQTVQSNPSKTSVSTQRPSTETVTKSTVRITASTAPTTTSTKRPKPTPTGKPSQKPNGQNTTRIDAKPTSKPSVNKPSTVKPPVSQSGGSTANRVRTTTEKPTATTTTRSTIIGTRFPPRNATVTTTTTVRPTRPIPSRRPTPTATKKPTIPPVKRITTTTTTPVITESVTSTGRPSTVAGIKNVTQSGGSSSSKVPTRPTSPGEQPSVTGERPSTATTPTTTVINKQPSKRPPTIGTKPSATTLPSVVGGSSRPGATTPKPAVTRRPITAQTQGTLTTTSSPKKPTPTSTTVVVVKDTPATRRPVTSSTQTNTTPSSLSTSSTSSISNEVISQDDTTNLVQGGDDKVESTSYSPGLVTWTSNSDDGTTRSPVNPTSTSEEPTNTEWTPITTPDGWVLIQSPSPNEPDDNLQGSPTTQSAITDKPSTVSTTTTTTTTERSTTKSSVPTVATTVSTTDNHIPTAELNMSDYKQVCGRRLFPESRIVGGARSSFGKWPWQISLRQWRTSTYLHKCGAALLNENWAITAAHCVENVPPSDLLLRLGEHDLASEDEPYGFQERRVQIVASHPQFDPRTFEYDLALLRFYEPLLPFQPNTLPICLPDDDANYVGLTAHVTGWGRLYEDGPLPSILQEVPVPVINNTVCEAMYRSAGYIEHIPKIFICAGWRKGGFDSCEGDSGGPLVIQRPRDKRWILAGVISWGIGCAEPNQPGVYTRISEFREWINQILQF